MDNEVKNPTPFDTTPKNRKYLGTNTKKKKKSRFYKTFFKVKIDLNNKTNHVHGSEDSTKKKC